MPKHIYDKDGNYKGKILSDEEHQEGIEKKRQRMNARIEVGKAVLPYLNLFLAWLLFIFISIGVLGGIISREIKGIPQEKNFWAVIGFTILILCLLWIWIRSARKKIKKLKQ